MADEKEKAGSKIMKAILSIVVGIVSGAVIMYLSPLVNSAIKPPTPVPNFSYKLDGLTATFDNRSTGATQGWWDFGDDSGLEVFSPNQASIVHKFPRPDSYRVKLSLHNLIGEGEERTVKLTIDPVRSPPTLDDFKVTALTSNRRGSSPYPTAPATFRVNGQLKNADLLIWCIDDHPLELVEVVSDALERTITFAAQGTKKIRVMAVAGKSKIEKEAAVIVDAPDNEPMVLIQQTSYAVATKTVPISVSIPAGFNGASYPFTVSRAVEPSETILDGTLDGVSDRLVRNPKLLIAADRKTFTVTGELLRQNGVGAVPASWFTKVELKLTGSGLQTAKRMNPVSAPLKLPGQTLVALPLAKDGLASAVEWEVRQGMDVVCKDSKVPAAQLATLNGKTYRVTVIPAGGKLQFDVEAK
jgi:PKD repeat protein